MDRCLFTACLLFSFLSSSGNLPAVSAAEPGQASGIKWHTDLHAAHRESIRLNKPVLIVFGAEWCHYCTKLEQESLNHPQIARYINQTYIPLHLDYDQAKREAKILNVTAVPCVVALTPQADLVGRLDGFASPQKVGAMLTRAKGLQTQIQQARYYEATRANTHTMTTAR